MIKENNKLILKAKKKRRMKKIIIIGIILIGIGIVFSIKSSFFIITKVSVLGNPVMSGDDIKKRTEGLIGQNILFIDKKNIISEAEKNPYVKSVEITKSYPKQVNIKITEKNGVFYVEKDGYYYVLDSEGTLLEKTDNINNRNLVNIVGIDLKNVELGNQSLDDTRILSFFDTFYQIISNNPTNYNIDSVNISDLMNIKVYIGKVEGRLGNDENIPDKMNKLLHIIESPDIGIVKGYVDVGFNGAPVYYKER
ncbi:MULTISPECIES: FtsQ-type POTRA domain-containing protein [unclassified Clostridium]|uniref:cell division protein FtsQ/DivIB n=1 Tax=unclassified Clostridium TaxID=2614128 RepID=UPI00029824AB|nr:MULTISPECIES: FtsQ-type POTRA domain-containing protein [unclassified Clostridium]EKQ56896.1 MAG: cell division septal protein [Clostridium sp. Maddingley MBC34-26]